MSLVITNAQEEDDPSLSPREDGEYISSCTIEGKKADCKSSEVIVPAICEYGTQLCYKF